MEEEKKIKISFDPQFYGVVFELIQKITSMFLLIFITSVLIFMFSILHGEPDLHDVLIERLLR